MSDGYKSGGTADSTARVLNNVFDGLTTAINNFSSSKGSGKTAVKEVKIVVNTDDIDRASRSVEGLQTVLDNFDKKGRRNYFASQINGFNAITDAVKKYDEAVKKSGTAGTKEMGAVVRNVNAYKAMGYDTESIKGYIALADELQKKLAQGRGGSSYKEGGIYSVEGFKSLFDIIQQVQNGLLDIGKIDVFDSLFGSKLRDNVADAKQALDEFKGKFNSEYFELNGNVADKILDTKVFKERFQQLVSDIKASYDEIDNATGKITGKQAVRFGGLYKELQSYFPVETNLIKAFNSIGENGEQLVAKLKNMFGDIPSILDERLVTGTETSGFKLNPSVIKDINKASKANEEALKKAAYEELSYPYGKQIEQLGILNKAYDDAIAKQTAFNESALSLNTKYLVGGGDTKSLEELLRLYQEFGVAMASMPKDNKAFQQYEKQMQTLFDAIVHLNELDSPAIKVDELKASLNDLVASNDPAKVQEMADNLRGLVAATETKIDSKSLEGMGLIKLVEQFRSLKQISADSEDNTKAIAEAISKLLNIDPSNLDQVIVKLRELGSLNKIGQFSIESKFAPLVSDANQLKQALQDISTPVEEKSESIASSQEKAANSTENLKNKIKETTQAQEELASSSKKVAGSNKEAVAALKKEIESFLELAKVNYKSAIEDIESYIEKANSVIAKSEGLKLDKATKEQLERVTNRMYGADGSLKIAKAQQQFNGININEAKNIDELIAKYKELRELRRDLPSTRNEVSAGINNALSSIPNIAKGLEEFKNVDPAKIEGIFKKLNFSSISVENALKALHELAGIQINTTDMRTGVDSATESVTALADSTENAEKKLKELYSIKGGESPEQLLTMYRELNNVLKTMPDNDVALELLNSIGDAINKIGKDAGVNNKDINNFLSELINSDAPDVIDRIASSLRGVSSAEQEVASAAPQVTQSIQEMYSLSGSESLEQLLEKYRELSNITESLSDDDAALEEYNTALDNVTKAIVKLASVDKKQLNTILFGLTQNNDANAINEAAKALRNVSSAEQEVADASQQVAQSSGLEKYLLKGNESLEQLLAMYRELGRVINGMNKNDPEYAKYLDVLDGINVAIQDLKELDSSNITLDLLDKLLKGVVEADSADVIPRVANALRDLAKAEEEAAYQTGAEQIGKTVDQTQKVLDKQVKAALQFIANSHRTIEALKADIEQINTLLGNSNLSDVQRGQLEDKKGKLLTSVSYAEKRQKVSAFNPSDIKNVEGLLEKYREFIDMLNGVSKKSSLFTDIVGTIDDIRIALLSLDEFKSLPDNKIASFDSILNSFGRDTSKNIQETTNSLLGLANAQNKVNQAKDAGGGNKSTIQEVSEKESNSIGKLTSNIEALVNEYYKLEELRSQPAGSSIADAIQSLIEGGASVDVDQSRIAGGALADAVRTRIVDEIIYGTKIPKDNIFDAFLSPNAEEAMKRFKQLLGDVADTGSVSAKAVERSSNNIDTLRQRLLSFSEVGKSFREMLEMLKELGKYSDAHDKDFAISDKYYDLLDKIKETDEFKKYIGKGKGAEERVDKAEEILLTSSFSVDTTIQKLEELTSKKKEATSATEEKANADRDAAAATQAATEANEDSLRTQEKIAQAEQNSATAAKENAESKEKTNQATQQETHQREQLANAIEQSNQTTQQEIQQQEQLANATGQVTAEIQAQTAARQEAAQAQTTTQQPTAQPATDATTVDLEARSKAIQEFTAAVDAFFTPLLAKLQEVNGTISALGDLVTQAQTILNTGFESTALSKALDIITQRKNELIQLRNELATTLAGSVPAQPAQEGSGQAVQTGNEFTILKDQIDAVTKAISEKNAALNAEKDLVNTVVESEKNKFGELEAKLNKEFPLAVGVKNKAFEGEKAVVDAAVDAEKEKFNELGKVLVETIPQALTEKNKAFEASAEAVGQTIEKEKGFLDDFVKKIQEVANNAKVNIKVTASGVQDSFSVIDAKINELGLGESIKGVNIAGVADAEKITKNINIAEEFAARQLQFQAELVNLEQNLVARSIDPSVLNPLNELLKNSRNIGDLQRLREELDHFKDLWNTTVPDDILKQYEDAVKEYLKLQKDIAKGTALGESMEQTKNLAEMQLNIITDLQNRFAALNGVQDNISARFGAVTENLAVEMKKLNGEFSGLNFDTATNGFKSLTEVAEKYYTMVVTQASGKPLEKGYDEFNDLRQKFEQAAQGLGVFADTSDEAKKASKALADEVAKLEKSFRADVIGKLESQFSTMDSYENRPAAYAKGLSAIRQALDELNRTPLNLNDFSGLQDFYGKATKLQETIDSVKKIDYGAPGVSEFEFKDAAAGYATLTKYAQEYYSLIAKQASGKNLTMGQLTRIEELGQYYDAEANKLGAFTDVTGNAAIAQREFANELERVKSLLSNDIFGNFENQLKNMEVVDGARPTAYFEGLEKLNQKFYEIKNNAKIELDSTSLTNLYGEVNKLYEELTKVSNIKFANLTSIAKVSGQMSEWMAKNPRAESYFPQIKALQDALGKQGLSNIDVNGIVGKFNLIKKAAAETGSLGSRYIDKLARSFSSLSRYLLSYVSFYRIIGVIRKAINVVKELDTALMEIRKVSKESVETLQQFGKIESFDLAEKTGTTAKQIQESTAAWLRLGKPFEEAKEAASASTWLLNVSEFDSIDAATTALVAMKQAYDDLDYVDIIDKLNMVGDNFSSSTDQLAEGMKNVSAVLQIQGNSMDQALALLASSVSRS